MKLALEKSSQFLYVVPYLSCWDVLKAAKFVSFLQVKEPEGFSDKSKKRSNADGSTPAQRRRRQPNQTKPITEFFKGPSKTTGQVADGENLSSSFKSQGLTESHLQGIPELI